MVGQTSAATHPHRSRHDIERQRFGQKIFTQHVGDAAIDSGGTGLPPPLLQQFALVPKLEPDITSGQGMAAHRVNAMRQFSGAAFQKLSSRRGAVKQFPHLDGGAACSRQRPQFATARIEQRGVPGLCGARTQREFAHRGDGRQRFAPKPHGGDRFEVAQRADFAGGVAAQRHGQVRRFHADAIVFHADQAHASLNQAHHDLAGTRIEGVVDQFTHHRGGAFDDFAGSDLADQFTWQFNNGAR
jgi:hypothetical protein